MKKFLFSILVKFPLAVIKFAVEKVVHLLLFLLHKRTPLKTKLTITGAFVYWFAPIDLIPDLIPLFGYCDDAVLILAAFVHAYCCCDPEIIESAKRKTSGIFQRLSFSSPQ